MAGDQSSLAACSSPAARPWPAASRALSRCQWASRRALALSVAMKLLVAATLRSVPAQSGTTNSLAASSGESSAFTRAMPRAPRSRRMRRLSTRSGLCPDCEKAKTACPATRSGERFRVTTDMGSEATGKPACCMAR